MYYRRKIFLALLSSFEGNLNSVDFEKLLFLYCQFSKKNHYDFFPYKYGCFSHISYQDKRVLMKQGFLKDSETFVLAKKEDYLQAVTDEDKALLEKFSSQFRTCRGNALIKKTYLGYPHYASKSEIAESVLDSNELAIVKTHNKRESNKTLFTIGYEGLTIDAYINKLITNNIAAVIDVRRNPLSMKYGFSKTKLKLYLEKAGIAYFHLPQLGIESKLRKNLESPSDYEALFEIYKNDHLPTMGGHLETVKKLLDDYKRAALTCFEAEHSFCHRNKITEWLGNDNTFNEKIVHI